MSFVNYTTLSYKCYHLQKLSVVWFDVRALTGYSEDFLLIMKPKKEKLETKQSDNLESELSISSHQRKQNLFFLEEAFCTPSHGRCKGKFCTSGDLHEHMGLLIMKYWLGIESMKQVPWHMGLFCWSEVLSNTRAMLTFISYSSFVSRLVLTQFTYPQVYELLIKRTKKSIQSG